MLSRAAPALLQAKLDSGIGPGVVPFIRHGRPRHHRGVLGTCLVLSGGNLFGRRGFKRGGLRSLFSRLVAQAAWPIGASRSRTAVRAGLRTAFTVAKGQRLARQGSLAVWAWLAVVLFASCRSLAGEAASTQATSSLDDLARRELQRPVDQTANERHSLSAVGQVAMFRNGVPLRTGLTLAAREDGHIRLEAETPEGSVVFAFVANDNHTLTLDFQSRRAFVSPPFTLPALGLAALDASMLSLLLLSRVPCEGPGEIKSQTSVVYEACAGGRVTTTFIRRPAPHRGWFLSGVELQKADGELVRATLRGHTTAGFARRIEVEGNEGRATISLDEIDGNASLDQQLFSMRVPPGFSTP